MKLFAFACMSLSILTARAQSFDDIISANRYIDCQDVTHNAQAIIADLYINDHVDSLYQFLHYWESKCGPMEYTFRLKNILDIKTGQFNPDSLSSWWIESLISYRRSAERRDYDLYYPYNRDLLSQTRAFDSLARYIASQTLSTSLDGSLILDFYSSKWPTFEKIRSAPDESRLKQLYNEMYMKTFRLPQSHLAFLTGVVQNYGNISIFGTRPNFGLAMGGKYLRHNFDLILDFRAGPSKEPYSFVYQDTLITDDTWTGMYVGLEYTFDFVQRGKIDIGLSPALGYDRITALTTENDYGEDPKFLSGFNKNIGLVVKYRFGAYGGYAGLHLRYNWVHYDNPGGTLLEGEYLNIRLTIGSIANFWRNSRLRALK